MSVLLACSHGTASPRGQAAVAGLVAAVAAALPEVDVRQAFVDVESPDVTSALAAATAGAEPDAPAARDTVVVPLLLSAGYHVHVDLTEAVTAVPGVRLAGALGPDQALVEVLAERLAETVAIPEVAPLAGEDRIVLGAAGSSDPRAVADCEQIGAELARRIGRPVQVAYGSSAEPGVRDAVAAARQPGGRVILVCHLLAPGWFHDRLSEAGADLVTAPLLVPGQEPDPRLVDLVVRRWAGA